jgi:DNA-binding response OmpR family regulator
VLDVKSRELRNSSGEHYDLTTAEFDLLLLFVKRPQRVLSRDDIMELLKGHDWSPLDRSIDVLVGRLRKKVERDGSKPQLIKTIRGVGYAFTADVKML